MPSKPAPLPPPLERDILKACLQWLTLHGWLAWRQNSGRMPWTDKAGKSRSFAFNGADGCADILGVKDGLFIAVETKRPGKQPTAKQQAFLDRVRAKGGIAICVHSVDELQELVLKAMGRE